MKEVGGHPVGIWGKSIKGKRRPRLRPGEDREGGREMQEGGDMGIYVYVKLIHFVIKQKLTNHCKAIILQ